MFKDSGNKNYVTNTLLSQVSHERNRFTVFFVLVGLACAHTAMTESPSPETFHFLFWLSLLLRLLYSLRGAYTFLRIRASQFEAQIALFSMAYAASIKKMFFTCFHLDRTVCFMSINLPHTELPNTPPSLPFSVFSTHMTAIK